MKKTPEELVNEIQQACKELGWHIAMDDSREHINGLVIGQTEYLEVVLSQLGDADNYSVYGYSGDNLQ